MEFLTQLWMPILVAAIFVFIVSSIIHMCLPIHKNDISKIDNEDAVIDTVRASAITPGQYMFPGCHSSAEMNSEEYKAKVERGPVGWLTVLPPGGFNMGKSLMQWFAFSIVVSACCAYVAWNGLDPGSSYLEVFQITGTVAFLVYGLGGMPESIWKGVSWKVTSKFMIDALLYALATGGAFGWLWPALDSVAGGLPTG